MKKSIQACELLSGDMVYSGRRCLFIDEVIPTDERHVQIRYTNGETDTLAKVAKVEIHVDDEDEGAQADYAEDEE